MTPVSQKLIEQEQEQEQHQDSLSNDHQNTENHQAAATDAVATINDNLIATLPETSEQDEDVISPIAVTKLSPLRKTSA